MSQPARSRRTPRHDRAAETDASTTSTAAQEAQEPDPDHELQLSFWRWGRVLFIVAALFFTVQLAAMVGGVVSGVLFVLLYAVFGGIVALVVAPISQALRSVMPRVPAALLSLLVLMAAIAVLVYGVGSPIASQAHQLSQTIPKLERPFLDLQHTLAAHGINVNLNAVATVLGINLSATSSGAVLVTAVGFTVRLVVDLVVTFIAAFWLLADWERLRSGLLAVLPGRVRTETDFTLNAFVVVFGGYLRAQLVLAAIVGVMSGVGSYLLGVPFALVVGVAAGVFELIPLAGPFVGAAIGALFAFTVSTSLTLEVVGLFVLIHIVEGYLIAPRIQARFVRLHPLVTLLALLAGVAAGGFFGAFFAVPLASLVAVIVRAHVADLRASQPDLFAVSPEQRAARGRRRTLLAEYRVNPRDVARRAARRVRTVFGGRAEP